MLFVVGPEALIPSLRPPLADFRGAKREVIKNQFAASMLKAQKAGFRCLVAVFKNGKQGV